MMLPLCPTSGKQAQKGYVYRCPDCRRWHLTRVPPEKIRRRRAS